MGVELFSVMSFEGSDAVEGKPVYLLWESRKGGTFGPSLSLPYFLGVLVPEANGLGLCVSTLPGTSIIVRWSIRSAATTRPPFTNTERASSGETPNAARSDSQRLMVSGLRCLVRCQIARPTCSMVTGPSLFFWVCRHTTHTKTWRQDSWKPQLQ